MTRALVSSSLLLGSLLLSACGARPGDSCKGGGYVCVSEIEAMECRDAVWRVLPCRGPAGCEESGNTVRCDLSANLPRDACAASAEGRGICTADGKGVLECRLGLLEQVRTCGSCSMDDARVTCQP